MLKKKLFLSTFLFFVLICPVFAVSYVDLERTTVGSLITDYGYALDFDAEDDYVNVLNNDSLNPNLAISFSIWIKLANLVPSSTYEGLVEKKHNGQYDFFLYPNMRYAVVYVDGVRKNFPSIVSVLPIDTWYHLVFVFNASSGEGTHYKNGVYDGKTTVASGNISSSDSSLRIGYNGLDYFDGLIDEVCIYNRAINETEISYSYNGGDGNIPLNQTGLILWLRMNEGSGEIAYDETANNNDGTLKPTYPSNCPSWVANQGKPPILETKGYPANIVILDLEANYEVKLYNSTSGLVCNATANIEGIANMTLPSIYRENAFEGTFRIYDDNATFLYSKWFEDIRGGDIYKARTKIGGLTFGIIALVIGLFALILALASVKVKR